MEASSTFGMILSRPQPTQKPIPEPIEREGRCRDCGDRFLVLSSAGLCYSCAAKRKNQFADLALPTIAEINAEIESDVIASVDPKPDPKPKEKVQNYRHRTHPKYEPRECVMTLRMSRESRRRLRNIAKRKGITMNDLVLDQVLTLLEEGKPSG